jgi:hypothetical protein
MIKKNLRGYWVQFKDLSKKVWFYFKIKILKHLNTMHTRVLANELKLLPKVKHRSTFLIPSIQ